MVLRSFFDYAGIVDCTHISLYTDSLKIPTKNEHAHIYVSLTALAFYDFSYSFHSHLPLHHRSECVNKLHTHYHEICQQECH